MRTIKQSKIMTQQIYINDILKTQNLLIWPPLVLCASLSPISSRDSGITQISQRADYPFCAYYFLGPHFLCLSIFTALSSLLPHRSLKKLGFRLSSSKSTDLLACSQKSPPLPRRPRFSASASPPAAAAAAAASRVYRSKLALTSQLCSLSSPCFGSSLLSLPHRL